MAHVLIASTETPTRDALAAPLRKGGHSVVTTADDALALAALRTVERPLVAILDERFGFLAANAIHDRAGGDTLLSQRAYVLIASSPQDASALTSSAVALDAVILPLPHSILSLLAAVQAAEDRLYQRAGEWPAAPEPLEASAATGASIALPVSEA